MSQNLDNNQLSEEIRYVSLETDADTTKRKNMYYSNAFTGFVWMLFHFTVVFFFGLELGSVALVWVFLAAWNFISFLLDVPVGILVKYFWEKKLTIAGTISQLFAGIIFLKFIYFSAVFTPESGSGITTLLGNFMDSGVNIALLIVASFCYGFTKEINDITTYSYIMNNADPSEYSAIISRNNIWNGIGMTLGLWVSGFILALNPTVAIIVLNAFIVLLIIFVLKFFDNAHETVELKDIQKLKVIIDKWGVNKAKEFLIGYISKADLATLAKTTKFLFIRPSAIKTDFSVKKAIEETKIEMLSIKKILLDIPYHIGLYWVMSIILVFGFWDTFATSFLIDFLAKLSKPELAYIILGIIAIPAFVMQEPFIKLSKKIGSFWVVCIGLVLSGSSLMIMSFSHNLFAIVLCGIINSFGFAAGMGMSQGGFLDIYNKVYATRLSLSEIDSNASASPLKMLQNIANVLGLTFGGILLAIFGYQGFFAVFGLLILGSLGASIFYKKIIDQGWLTQQSTPETLPLAKSTAS